MTARSVLDPARLVLASLCLLFLAALAGCASPKTVAPLPGALMNPNADYIDAATQQKALDRGAWSVPDPVSRMQDTGLSHLEQTEEVFRLPDGQPFLLDLGNGRKVPLWEKRMSYTKWSSLHELAGGKIKHLFLGMGTLFGAREQTQPTGEVAKAAQGRRNGFMLDIDELEGSLSKSSAQLSAKYEGQANLQKMLNQGIEVSWAGAKGYIEVRDDGLCKIIASTAAGVKDVVGEVIKITPYGTANALGEKALKVLVKPADDAGKVPPGSAATSVDVLPPATNGP